MMKSSFCVFDGSCYTSLCASYPVAPPSTAKRKETSGAQHCEGELPLSRCRRRRRRNIINLNLIIGPSRLRWRVRFTMCRQGDLPLINSPIDLAIQSVFFASHSHAGRLESGLRRQHHFLYKNRFYSIVLRMAMARGKKSSETCGSEC